MKVVKLLSSLPATVRAWAENQLRLRETPSHESDIEIRKRIKRLVSWDDLSESWHSIGRLESKHEAFTALEVAYRAVAAPSHWKSINKSRRSDVERGLSQTSEAAYKLATLLYENRENLRYWVHPELDTAELLQKAAAASDNPLVATLYETEVEVTVRRSLGLTIDCDLNPYFPRLHEVIYELSRSLKLAGKTEELLLRPTKSGDPNAGRTFTIRTLAHYFRSTTSKPYHKVVAALAYAAFDGDEEITEGLVTQLTRDLAKK